MRPLGGDSLREWALEVMTERMTVRELIRGRVYQEVQDYNQKRGQVFQGMIQPEDDEKDLNRWKLKKPASSTGKSSSTLPINDWQADSIDDLEPPWPGRSYRTAH